MARFLLKLVIMATLWVLGGALFSSVGGEGGLMGNALFVGESILGSSLASDAGSVTGLLLSFIITLAIYYVAAEIIAFSLTRAFGRK